MPIFKLFLDICLFRKGPQDIPLSGFLLVLTLMFTLSTSILLSWVEVEFFQAILQSLCATSLLVGFFFGMLRMAGKMTRFPQSLIAALAADGMITALAITLVLVSVALPEWRAAVSLLLLAMMLWELAVLGSYHPASHGLSSLRTGLCSGVRLHGPQHEDYDGAVSPFDLIRRTA